MRCAVFPCMGLGDGLIALVLSNNLFRAGYEVDTFHPFMSQMQPLFPDLSIRPRLEANLNYDRLFFIYEKLDWMQTLLKEALKKYRDQTTVLNPIATPNRDYLFWEEGRFDGSRPFVTNLFTYCRDLLNIKDPTTSNGITLPPHVTVQKYSKRVIIHPTSSRPGKNWSPAKYLSLADQLFFAGYEPVFILTEEEKIDWPNIESPHFNDLVELTHFIAESGSMIGNDSGIGHLASCLGLPTLTICRNRLSANFWRPAWGPGKVIVPPRWIPNIKWMRWRDKKWQHFVPVKQVLNTFLSINS